MQPSSKSSLILSWRILPLNDLRVSTSLILLGNFVHSLGPRNLINRVFAISDSFIPGHREIGLSQIVIKLLCTLKIFAGYSLFRLCFVHEDA